ncbi:hypothetical protein ACN47E_008918 [Coniothyrium glycines]
MAPTVPRFASFRPKPKDAAPPSSNPPPPPSDEPQPRPLVDNKKKKKNKIHAESSPPSARKADHRRTGSLAADLYFSDRRGDPDVLRYGSLHSHHVPAYRRSGYGCVLGLNLHMKIDRETTTSKSMLITPATKARQERRLTNKQYNKSNGRALKLILKAEPEVQTDLDFIPLTDQNAVNRDRRSDDDDDDGHVPLTDYRDIKSKVDSMDTTDPDARYESELSLGLDNAMTRLQAALLKNTREHPRDLDNWLALIDHQRNMLQLDQPSTDLTASAKAHLADVRISLYEDALKNIGTDSASRCRLYQGLLLEARNSWHVTKLMSKWKEVLAQYPESFELRLQHLDFVQSSFTTFKFESCRSVMVGSLKAVCHSTGISPPSILHLVLRLTCMASDAGYQELAIATWQALLEFLSLRPAENATLAAFETFWDSEVPRIGELGAKGWKHYVCTEDQAQPPEPPALAEFPSVPSDIGAFEKRESDASSKLKFPGRTSHTVGEDDAFHTILFPDIEDVLKVVPVETPSILLVQAFLIFLGLPSMPPLANIEQQWHSDPFLIRQLRPTVHGTEGVFTSTRYAFDAFLDCTVQDVHMTSELLFQQMFEVSDIECKHFVRRLLHMLLLDSATFEDVGEYILAFELHNFPAEVCKTAKRLLKARPLSQRLYNAYGLVEVHRGHLEQADQVFRMAISLKTDNSSAACETLYLMSNWVWLALLRGEHTEATWRLVTHLDELPSVAQRANGPGRNTVECAATKFRHMIEAYLLQADYMSAIISTSLLAILMYLANHNAIEEALAIHQNLSTWMTSHSMLSSPFAEVQAQTIVRLLIYHATNAPIVKPGLIRTTLEPLIRTFPDNTLLLAMYAANEVRFSIDNRVRGIFHENVLFSSTRTRIAGWAFAIRFEQARGPLAGSTAHSVRAAFQRAVHTSGAHCPAIWKYFVLFELEQVQHSTVMWSERAARTSNRADKCKPQLDEDRQRLKDTFFLGLQSLPWSKDYTMLAFTALGSFFNDGEKWKLYRLMQEKEMRLYTDLDDVPT